MAQGVTIGSSTPPDPSAILDLQTANQGFLMPRLTTVQRNAIPNPALGLQIYNLDTDCVELFFASGGWKPVQCGCGLNNNATFTLPIAYRGLPTTISGPTNLAYNWTFQNASPATANTQSAQATWPNN